MEKFENITENNKELAIKVGSKVPADAVGLAFLSSDPISPSNTVSILDLSDTIPENRIVTTSADKTELVYADEFGVLKHFDGRNNFPVNDLTISNLFLNKPTYTENIDISKTNPKEFVHYFYVSRFFISAPSDFSLPNLRFWVPEENFKGLKIDVVDQNGLQYKDEKTGLKKYRILLEPYLTGLNYNRTEVPCRVIVLLDIDYPSNLKLIYDKVECDLLGNMSNQVLRYSESINAVKYFTEIPEETFVIDPNYSDKSNFSIKKINQKYSNIVNNDISAPGYQIITPSKALKDCRTFEAFNWRLIARTRRNINFEISNYGQEIDGDGNVIQQTVKVAVLYSSANNDTSNSIVNPYIFYRLGNSPFNLSKYNFINPATNLSDKTLADYWKVDIDLVDDISSYDILAWSPTSSITSNQAHKINLFLRKSGTLILDISNGSVDASLLNPQLQVAEFETLATHVDIVDSANIIDPTKNGGWSISNFSFEKQYYSILGSSYSYRNEATKKYITFDKENGIYADSNSFLNIGETVTDMPSVGLAIDYPNAGDSVSKGTLIATTFPLMAYCNAIYSLGFDEDVFDLNTGTSAVPDPLGNTYAAVLEGPFKLLYNTVAYGLYCKSKASTFRDFRSSLFNFVTPWNSSWVMDSEALLEQEKRLFSLVNIDASTQVYARDLIPQSATIFDFYKSQLDLFVNESQKSILNTISESDVEFFIELTNDDVSLANSDKIDPTNFVENNIPSAYSLFKLNNGISKVYSYTLKPSKKINIPEIMGPYCVIEQNLSVSEEKSLDNKLSVLNNFKAYPFNFDVKYTYASAGDANITLSTDVETEFIATFPAKLTTVSEVEVIIDPPDIPGEWVDETLTVSKNAINIKSSIDDLGLLRTSNSTDPINTYLYSGDIDIHKDPRIWKSTYTGTQTGTTSTSTTSFTTTVGTVSEILGSGRYELSEIYSKFGFTSSLAMQSDLLASNLDKTYYYQGYNYYVTLYEAIANSAAPSGFVTIETAFKYYAHLSTAFGTLYRTDNIERWKIYLDSRKYDGLTYFLPYGQTATVYYISETSTTHVTVSLIPSIVKYYKANVKTNITNPDLVAGESISSTTTTTTTAGTAGSYASPAHEYVKYIQYTMATIGGQVCKVDGLYGPQTTGAVRNFQTAQNQRYLDGTVDSETKSYMAFAWKKLKATNPTLFNTYKSGVPDPAITKYITAVENARTAPQIDGTTAYKKLSFSGFTGPSTASDIIWFEVPDGITTINNITIEPDSNPIWRNFSVIGYGYSSSYTTNIFNTKIVNTNISAVSANPVINMGGISRTASRYMWVWISGRSISGFGSAEGFSVKSIKINGIYKTRTWKPGVEVPPYTETELVTNVSEIMISTKVVGRFNNLPVDIYNSYSRNIDTTVLNSNFYISEITYTESGELNRRVLSPDQINIGDIYNLDGLEVNFGLSPSNLLLENVEIIEVRSQGLPVLNSSVGIEFTFNSFKLSTSAAYFSDSVIVTKSQHLENYRLRTVGGNLLPAGINSVTVNDGILLVCNGNGLPYGLLTETDIKNSITVPTSIIEQEIDLRYGFMILDNLQAEDQGFIYGFYDILEKEFLGKTVPVLEIYDRGFSNVYIAVCAIDADGNTQNDNEFIGPSVDITFKPVNIPFKYIAPVYSVKYSNNSIIKVSLPDENLSKFEVWELPVSSGSFVKRMDISNRSWLDWKSKYIGQQLTAVYSTGSLDTKVPSPIFGSDYYSILNENPTVINDKTIRVSRTPILSWNHPTNYLRTPAGIVKPEIDIFLYENETWNTVPYSDVREINCETGIIEFKSRIVPSDNSLIKVNYTIPMKDNLISQVDGIPIPLNPFINRNEVIFNKPLYIYLKPIIIYKKEIDPITITIWPPVSPVSRYVVVDEYSSSSAINFTYDTSIFNQSSENYDPFALPIAAMYVYNNPYNSIPDITDIRLRGGGFKNDIPVTTLTENYPDVISSWDIYPPSGKAYPKGGYVIIRIPNSVKTHFTSQEEIYNIISANLTAGIVYELQDLEGNPWSRDA